MYTIHTALCSLHTDLRPTKDILSYSPQLKCRLCFLSLLVQPPKRCLLWDLVGLLTHSELLTVQPIFKQNQHIVKTVVTKVRIQLKLKRCTILISQSSHISLSSGTSFSLSLFLYQIEQLSKCPNRNKMQAKDTNHISLFKFSSSHTENFKFKNKQKLW